MENFRYWNRELEGARRFSGTRKSYDQASWNNITAYIRICWFHINWDINPDPNAEWYKNFKEDFETSERNNKNENS